MSYNINKSNSDPVTIPTGAIDNQFDIPLVGQDAINYGDDLALAFVRLLENFANNTAPSFGSARTTGQLWYDTTGTGTLRIFDGTSFVAIPKTSEVVLNTGDQNITGDKTFTGTPNFNGGTSGVDSPFTVDSTFVVTNLNAQFLNDSGTPRPASDFALAASVIGKQTLYIPATRMYPQTTGGAEGEAGAGASTANFVPTRVELTANQPMINVWEFDESSQEAVQFNIAFPQSWNEGTVTYEVYWAANSASTNGVSWGLQAVAMGNTEDIDVAFGTAVIASSSNAGVHTLNRTSESTAVTIAGTPGEDNMSFFRLYRDVSNPSDDLAADARLIGIKLFFTTDAPTDD